MKAKVILNKMMGRKFWMLRPFIFFFAIVYIPCLMLSKMFNVLLEDMVRLITDPDSNNDDNPFP